MYVHEIDKAKEQLLGYTNKDKICFSVSSNKGKVFCFGKKKIANL